MVKNSSSCQNPAEILWFKGNGGQPAHPLTEMSCTWQNATKEYTLGNIQH